MALVKTTELSGKLVAKVDPTTKPKDDEIQPSVSRRRAQDRSRARQEKAAERIGTAIEELTAGVAEASSAAEELSKSLEQIASAAEEAAGAAQESQASVNSLGAVFSQGRTRAEILRRKSEDLQVLLTDVGTQISALVHSVEESSARQLRTVEVVMALESQAANIGDITKTVGDISDQTSLLALNAAIEAARAGDHGRGFSVVADEVRAFAEASEKGAREINGLANSVAAEVRAVVDRIKRAAERAQVEARSGLEVVTNLGTIRSDMKSMVDGALAILTATVEAENGAREAQRGAEQVASAAEEQSAATAEAQRAVQQQTASLEESHRTARALTRLADGFHNGAGITGAQELATAAEELSAAVQELSGAASQILTAVDQIGRGAQAQAAATQESTAAMAQIEKAAVSIRAASFEAVEQIDAIAPLLASTRARVSKLSDSISDAVKENHSVIALMGALEVSARRIEKIVDGISLVSVQTNMLAVSGSVEAARAGEFGRGFAVVSSDIRNLSRQSAENADRVKEVVRSIQDTMAAVRRELELLATASQSEIARNEATVARLATVVDEVVTMKGSSSDLAASSDVVLRAINEVLEGTRQIAAAAEEASGSAAEAATAARQQARGAEDLAAAIEEIASLADELQIAKT
jgi:methyl-accepting chemotaxis protein